MALVDGNISPTYMIQTAVFDIALCEIQSKFVDTIKHKINGLLVPGIGDGGPNILFIKSMEDSKTRVKRKPVGNGCMNRPTPDLPSNRRPLNLQGDGGTFEEKFINRSN